MKSLSLLQPWASLVVMGHKTVETRSWSTPYRGQLLIHASLGKSGSEFCLQQPFKKFIPNFNALPFGAIIGEVTLTKILPVDQFFKSHADMNKLTLEEKAFGDYSAGRFGWLLENAFAYEHPIFCRGHLKLWEVNLRDWK